MERTIAKIEWLENKDSRTSSRVPDQNPEAERA